MGKVLTIDYETYYDDEVSVKTLGAGQYAAHPSTEIYLLAACDGEHSWVGHPRDFNWDVLDNYEGLVAYNCFFEEAMSEIGLPRMGINFPARKLPWLDASDLGAFSLQTTSLNATIRKAYGQTLDKAARTSMKGKTLEDVSPAMRQRFLEYAKRDALWTHKLWQDYSPGWSSWERKLSYITRVGSRKGVKIDVEKLNRYIAAAQEEVFNIERSLPWVDELNEKPTSTKAIANQCRLAGIPVPPVKDRDEEGYIIWENTHKERNPWILKVGEWRSTNKLLGTLLTIRSRLRPDNTIESPTRYFGACSTGRWSGESGLNFQNLRKSPLVCAGIEIDIRSLIIPRDGTKMFIADLAQIEPRVLNWLVGNEEMLDMMRRGMSPYQAFAVANLGWRGGDVKKEDPNRYALFKVMVLGLGYQAGAVKFQSMADTLSGGKVQLTMEQAQETVDLFRRSAPLLSDPEKGMWATLDKEFKKAAATDKHFEFELPSGRIIRYPNITTTYRSYPEMKEISRIVDGKAVRETRMVPKKKKVHLVEVDGRKKSVYGGLLTENCTQAAARDVFGLCLENLFDAGLHVPFTVHDEAVIEAPPECTIKDIEELMAVKPEWMPGLPVEAEVKEAPHYLK